MKDLEWAPLSSYQKVYSLVTRVPSTLSSRFFPSPIEACNSLSFNVASENSLLSLQKKSSKLHVCIINQHSSANSQLNSFNYNPVLSNLEYVGLFLLEDLSSNVFRLVTDLAVRMTKTACFLGTIDNINKVNYVLLVYTK